MNKIDTYAVVGNPIEHSLSPQIHHQFALKIGKTLQYDKIVAELDSFEDTVRQFFARGGKGLNITVPFKFAAFEICDNVEGRAKSTHAVNTLWMEGNLLCGESTDGRGLLRDLERRCGCKVTGSRVLLLGAGGTVASVLPDLLDANPSSIHVANRTLAKAEQLKSLYPEISISEMQHVPHLSQEKYDIIINATSASLQNQLPPIDERILADCHCYYDCVYGEKAKPFQNEIKKLGVNSVFDGIGMLVEQAALSFYRWHGVMPETDGVVLGMIDC